jgi:hypothetical protein
MTGTPVTLDESDEPCEGADLTTETYKERISGKVPSTKVSGSPGGATPPQPPNPPDPQQAE